MKIAILSESSADDAALRILVDAIVEVRSEPVAVNLRTRGWPAVRIDLPPVIRALHYRTDADGLVVVADSNHSPFVPNNTPSRLHELQQRVQTLLASLSPVHGRPVIPVAIGVACPAIEAWLLCHRRPEISEAAWQTGLATKIDPYTKLDLKRFLYGVERPSLKLETEKMIEAATELSAKIDVLEAQFPLGFGAFARELRRWRKDKDSDNKPKKIEAG
jgi:hypothetical protein